MARHSISATLFLHTQLPTTLFNPVLHVCVLVGVALASLARILCQHLRQHIIRARVREASEQARRGAMSCSLL